MKRLTAFPSRFLSLILFLGLFVAIGSPASARASSSEVRHTSSAQVTPVFGEWFESINLNGTSNRRTVVRVAALGMALALFIMFRSKH